MKLRHWHRDLVSSGRVGRAWLRHRRMEVVVVILCALMSALVPLYAFAHPVVKKSWVTVYETPKEAASPTGAPAQAERPSSDEAFGRQLDTLTSFYGTVITVLTVMLAAVVSLAFFTVRAGSRAEMDKALRDVVESQDFRNYLQTKIQAGVSEGIDDRLGNVQDLVDELQQMYEALDDVVVRRQRENSDGNRQD